ncbi:MAG TPA: TIGR01777 family oxidoreductase [Bacteroidia bacterium]|nr:TIGR01777 family oxidoreductase [Bacteroidia bacterium]
MEEKKILIAGGSGLIGKMLSEHFSSHGYTVNILSRQREPRNNFYFWNPAKEMMDDEALRDVACIINLGGASLAAGRWSQKRKQEIINSRIQSTDFLFHKLKTGKHSVETFISASAVGYYGNHGDEWVDESFPAGEDFLSKCCRYWEESAMKVSSLEIRTTIFRIGIVLTKNGGALPLLALPVKLFAGSPLGSGRQFISWIHHRDLCSMFLKAAEDKRMNGMFNAVSPEPLTNKEFMKTLARIFHRPFFLPAVPAPLLNLILGEKAVTVTGGQRVSCKKILDAGFAFQFPALRNALEDIYQKNQ